MRPQSVPELSLQLKDYNYSNNIPLKLWIRTLNLLLGNSNSYLRQGYYDECYKLLIRFCEIMLNKLNNHPEVKLFKQSTIPQQRLIYLEYHQLLYKRMPLVLEEVDKLKEIINKNYQDYIDIKRENERIRKLQEEKYLQQRRLYSSSSSSINQNQLNSNNVNDNLKDDDDDDFFQTLSKNSQLKKQLNGDNGDFSETPRYPELPLKQSNDNHDNSFRYDFPAYKDVTSSTTGLPPPAPPPVPLKYRGNHVTQSIITPEGTPSPPQVPGKVPTTTDKKEDVDLIVHKTVNFTEGGLPLRSIFVSANLQKEFLKISQRNTLKKLETCGILAGKLSRNAFFITHLLIPEQISTPNTCETLNEEDLFFTVDKLDLFILGWIHTHPTQSCFLSSVDLHTQNSYQIMLNEAIAIVLSPDTKFSHQDFGCFRLTDPPGLPTISKCNKTGFHPHEESNLYVTCNRVNNDTKMGHVIIKDHLPFEVIDLRKSSSSSSSSKKHVTTTKPL